MTLTLDVGCGSFKRADIGIDKRSLPNVDVLVDLDGGNLPFLDNTFTPVLSHHSIEHCKNPELVIKEMLRVSNSIVQIICPHRYGEYAKISKEHKQFLNKRWFLELAKRLNVEVSVKTTFSPTFYLGVIGLLMRPNELIVEFRKK